MRKIGPGFAVHGWVLRTNARAKPHVAKVSSARVAESERTRGTSASSSFGSSAHWRLPVIRFGKKPPAERRENGPSASVAGRLERATRATTRGGAESRHAHLDTPPKTNRPSVAMGPPAAEFQVPDAVARRREDASSSMSVQERFRADHMAAALRERAAFGDAETETARDILLEAAPLLVAKKLVVPDDTMVRTPRRQPTPRPRPGRSAPARCPFPARGIPFHRAKNIRAFFRVPRWPIPIPTRRRLAARARTSKAPHARSSEPGGSRPSFHPLRPLRLLRPSAIDTPRAPTLTVPFPRAPPRDANIRRTGSQDVARVRRVHRRGMRSRRVHVSFARDER